jgi:hypothetical protein
MVYFEKEGKKASRKLNRGTRDDRHAKGVTRAMDAIRVGMSERPDRRWELKAHAKAPRTSFLKLLKSPNFLVT